MAWHENMVIILRTLINDFDTGSPTYQDEKLEQILVVAAHFVNKEVELEYTYTVNVEAISISPDPVDNGDAAFTNLVCLKAACLIVGAETKALSASAFRIEDASAAIDTKDAYRSLKEMYDKYCEMYDKAKLDYVAGNLSSVAAILTPTTVDENGYSGIIFG